MNTAITVVVVSSDPQAMFVFPGHLGKTNARARTLAEAHYPPTVELAAWHDWASSDPTVTARHLRTVGQLVRVAVWGEHHS